jgi:hypothetical protein
MPENPYRKRECLSAYYDNPLGRDPDELILGSGRAIDCENDASGERSLLVWGLA